MIKKGIKILTTIAIVLSTMCATVFAEDVPPGHEQKLQFFHANNSEVHYYKATEEGKDFYVYCFNSELKWPEMPWGPSSGNTIETYVPDNFNHLSDEVKDKIHRIFYAGYPHNNAGLYVLTENTVPTTSDLNNALSTNAYLKNIFPELNGLTLTFEGVGVGALYDYSSQESQALMSVGEKMMEWSYAGTAEQLEIVKAIMTNYPRFFAMANAYYQSIEWFEDPEILITIYMDYLIPSGVVVTEEEAHTATQYAIWIILKQSGVPYNNKDLEGYMVEGSLTEALVNFANSPTPRIPDRDYDQVYLEAYRTAFNDQQYLLNSKGQTLKEAGGVLILHTIPRMASIIPNY